MLDDKLASLPLSALFAAEQGAIEETDGDDVAERTTRQMDLESCEE